MAVQTDEADDNKTTLVQTFLKFLKFLDVVLCGVFSNVGVVGTVRTTSDMWSTTTKLLGKCAS